MNIQSKIGLMHTIRQFELDDLRMMLRQWAGSHGGERFQRRLEVLLQVRQIRYHDANTKLWEEQL